MKDTPKSTADTPHPDIQEILAKRREMLNRVRADLKKVDELQNDFWKQEEKRIADRTERP